MDAAPTPSPVPASAPPRTPDVVNAWPPSAQWVTAFLVGVATTLLIVHSLSCLRWGTRPTELAYRIDLNQASAAELRQLPRIGETLVTRILEHREKKGPFSSVDELRMVQGIGPATLERLRPWVMVVPLSADPAEEGQSEPALRAYAVPVKLVSPPSGPGAPRAPGKKEENLKGPININRAALEELQRLPGIGPKLSQRILEERGKRPFQSVDDLRRVPGIGPKTLEKLRPFITIGGEPPRVAQSG